MKTYSFTPASYVHTMGNHSPVLRVSSNDRIITSCLDARGYDANNQQIVASGNPLTGPFYVEGAEPGDTLAVKLERITPSRRHGWSGWLLAAHVVEAADVATLAQADTSDEAWNWDVDVTAGTARLDHSTSPWHERSLALAPMLGCFGVAPARGQAITSLTSGTHGGNMDYRGFQAGSTAYFPVFEPGALFFLGDGHAAQGDGEIIGTGIEISVNVEFRVRVVKHQRIRWPRGQDEHSIFTLGNARPLEQGLQHATSEMLHWLMEGYNLDVPHASLLLGFAGRYDLGNVINPAYTVVCKLPKQLLPGSMHPDQEREKPA